MLNALKSIWSSEFPLKLCMICNHKKRINTNDNNNKYEYVVSQCFTWNGFNGTLNTESMSYINDVYFFNYLLSLHSSHFLFSFTKIIPTHCQVF